MSDQTGSPSRYARTAQGLVASLVVTVVVVIAVALFLRADNGAAEQGPETVDYAEAVDAAEGAGIDVVRPQTEPAGWRATSVDFDADGSTGTGAEGGARTWGIGFLTEDEEFAGVHQEDADLDDVLETYVDPDPQQGDDITVDSPLARTWQSWSDSGGDHAYSATVTIDGEQAVVLVYGSASTADLRELLDSLVLG